MVTTSLEKLHKKMEHMQDIVRCPVCRRTTIMPSRPLECDHFFCSDCLFQAQKMNKECPLCRAKIINKRAIVKEKPQGDAIKALLNLFKAYNSDLEAYGQASNDNLIMDSQIPTLMPFFPPLSPRGSFQRRKQRSDLLDFGRILEGLEEEAEEDEDITEAAAEEENFPITISRKKNNTSLHVPMEEGKENAMEISKNEEKVSDILNLSQSSQNICKEKEDLRSPGRPFPSQPQSIVSSPIRSQLRSLAKSPRKLSKAQTTPSQRNQKTVSPSPGKRRRIELVSGLEMTGSDSKEDCCDAGDGLGRHEIGTVSAAAISLESACNRIQFEMTETAKRGSGNLVKCFVDLFPWMIELFPDESDWQLLYQTGRKVVADGNIMKSDECEEESEKKERTIESTDLQSTNAEKKEEEGKDQRKTSSFVVDSCNTTDMSRQDTDLKTTSKESVGVELSQETISAIEKSEEKKAEKTAETPVRSRVEQAESKEIESMTESIPRLPSSINTLSDRDTEDGELFTMRRSPPPKPPQPETESSNSQLIPAALVSEVDEQIESEKKALVGEETRNPTEKINPEIATFLTEDSLGLTASQIEQCFSSEELSDAEQIESEKKALVEEATGNSTEKKNPVIATFATEDSLGLTASQIEQCFSSEELSDANLFPTEEEMPVSPIKKKKEEEEEKKKEKEVEEVPDTMEVDDNDLIAAADQAMQKVIEEENQKPQAETEEGKMPSEFLVENRVISHSGFSGGKRELLKVVKRFCKTFSFQLDNNVTSNTVCLIVAVEPAKLTCDRTLKYLKAISQQKWIISFEWIEKCLNDDNLSSPVPYEIIGDTAVSSDGGPTYPRYSRLRTKRLFHASDVVVTIMGEFKYPTKEDVRELALESGLKVVSEEEMLRIGGRGSRGGAGIVIIDETHDCPLSEEQKTKVKSAECEVVSKEWLFNSIGLQAVESMASYIKNEYID